MIAVKTLDIITSKFYLFFLIIGLLLTATIYFSNATYFINIASAYISLTGSSMAFLVLIYFLASALLYFAVRNYLKLQLGMANLILVALPVIYIIYHNYRAKKNIQSPFDQNNYETWRWTEEYLPNIFILLFELEIFYY